MRRYKDLADVERCFANLKDVIDMRPIYHQTKDRVQAHIFVAALAHLLHRAVENKLKAARIDLSAINALTALRSVRVVDIDLGINRRLGDADRAEFSRATASWSRTPD
jgi:hypothetical protein